jgi:hypothetical protein
MAPGILTSFYDAHLSAVPSDRQTSLSSESWWLRSVMGTGEGGIKLLSSDFTDTARGRTAELRRQSDDSLSSMGTCPMPDPLLIL